MDSGKNRVDPVEYEAKLKAEHTEKQKTELREKVAKLQKQLDRLESTDEGN